MAALDPIEIEKDREAKKCLVVDTIASHCNATSHHAILREIGHAIKTLGEVLVAEIIKGGVTNFSYKVYLSSSRDKALFVKLCFPYPLWNIENHYDVQRTVNEYEMLMKLSKLAPECVASPYICESVDDMMLLVTEWCSGADELFAQQFIKGQIDFRLASKLANTTAKLHCCKDFDRGFNNNVRETVTLFWPPMTDALCSMSDDSADAKIRASQTAKEMGKDECALLMDRCLKNYESDRECLIHSDLHVFNILVENKPSVESLNLFGPNGSITLCDWEMSLVGPIGRDIGFLCAFPTASALAHAMNENKDAAIRTLDFLETLWNEYAAALKREGNKSDEELLRIYRNVVGWCGCFMFGVFFVMGVHLNLLPIDQNAESDREMLKDSVGTLGIKFLRLGFGDENHKSTLEELRGSYRSALLEEIDVIKSVKRQKSICSSDRHVNDASLGRGSRTLVSYGEESEFELHQ